MSEAPRVIQRNVGTIDERLPWKTFLALTQQQADATPLEIIENGVVYEAFDCKIQIEGHMLPSIVFYRIKEAR